MQNYFQKAQYFALTISVAGAMSGIALAQDATDPNQSNPSVNQNYSSSNNSNSMMSQAQQELKDKGFYKGQVDGIYGPKTRMAIRHYQMSIHVIPSGRLDHATLGRLGLASSGQASRSADQSSNNGNYTSGQNSSNVSSDSMLQAQQKLADGGYYKGKVDGMMNDGTRSAIRQYQHDKKLQVTGHMNRETTKSMGIDTSQGKFDNNGNLIEQLGKGVAEGTKAPLNKNTNPSPNTQQH